MTLISQHCIVPEDRVSKNTRPILSRSVDFLSYTKVMSCTSMYKYRVLKVHVGYPQAYTHTHMHHKKHHLLEADTYTLYIYTVCVPVKRSHSRAYAHNHREHTRTHTHTHTEIEQLFEVGALVYLYFSSHVYNSKRSMKSTCIRRASIGSPV